MIKYIDWGKHIRLGNFLYLYAGISSFANKSGNQLVLPDYFLWKYLENPPEISNDMNYDELFHFRQTNYTPEEKEYIIDYFTKSKDKIVNINLGSHLQSEKWFIDDLDYVKSVLKIKQSEINNVRLKYPLHLSKPAIGIGIRRGDFVGHGVFYQIPEKWYVETLEKEFPNWRNENNVIVFSDDIEWCKKYYKDYPFYYAEPNNTHLHSDGFKHYHKDPMEQFILGTQCSHFIGGSSTFSWWQMWYIKNNMNNNILDVSKVIHCGQNLRGKALETFYNPDYYPEGWICCPC